MLRWRSIRAAAGFAFATVVLSLGLTALIRRGAVDRDNDLASVRAAWTNAQLLAEQGRLDEAQESIRRSAAGAEKLAEWSPTDTVLRHERVAILETMGQILTRDGLARETVETVRLSIELRAMLVAEEPGSLADRLRMAESLDRLGVLLDEAGRWEEAQQPFARGRGLCETALPLISSDPGLRERLSSLLFHQGRLLLDLGPRAEGVRALEEAITIQERRVVESPGDSVLRHRLIGQLLELSRAITADGRTDEAKRILSRAAEHADRLMSDDPGNGSREVSAEVLEEQAGLLRRQPTSVPAACSCLQQAIVRREAAAGASSGPTASIARLAADYDALAGLLQERGLFQEAEALYRKAVTCQSRRLAGRPAWPPGQYAHGRALHNLAEFLRVRGRTDEALSLQRQAVEELATLYRSDGKEPKIRAALSYAYWTLCAIHLDRKDHRAAASLVVEYLRLEPNGYEEPIESSRFFCRCIRLASDDQSLSSLERNSARRAYGNQAIHALRIAASHGYNDRAQLLSSPDYEPIRSLEDFQDLVRRIERLDEPVARRS